jgi:hypothetical protein
VTTVQKINDNVSDASLTQVVAMGYSNSSTIVKRVDTAIYPLGPSASQVTTVQRIDEMNGDASSSYVVALG